MVLFALFTTTNAVIFFNVPVLRQVLGLVCFSFLPGFLFLYIFKQNKLSFLKLFLVAFGLSVTFLTFGSLFINWVYPLFGYNTPLSKISLILSFSATLVILSLIAYLTNKANFHLVSPNLFAKTKASLKKTNLISVVIFPILFPLFSVLGTFLMEVSGNNVVLIIMLVLIPVYVVTVVILRKQIPKITYPIAISAISLALLLMSGLPSHYLLGIDVQFEYRVSVTTLSNLVWDISNYVDPANTTLSTSLLPIVYEQILGINTIYVYKVVFNLIISLIPLAVYVLVNKRIRDPGAFLASLLFISQITFLYSLQSSMKQGIALLFFAVAMMALLDKETTPLTRKALFSTFLFSMIVSHYTTSYVCFFLLIIVWLISMVLRKWSTSANDQVVTGVTIAIIFAVIFLWYNQINFGFTSLVTFFEFYFRNLMDFFTIESRSTEVLVILGTETKGILATIWVVVNWITITFMGFGIIKLLIDYIRGKKLIIESTFLALICASALLLSLTVILPHISIYNPSRLYIQTLIFLAPAFVIGGRAISNLFRTPQASLFLMVLVLLAQFVCATYIAPKAFNIISVAVTRESYAYDKYYIHETEVIALQWLDRHAGSDTKVYCDGAYGFRFLNSSVEKIKPDNTFFSQGTESDDGRYIYLSEANVIGRRIYPSLGSPEAKNISSYYHLLESRNKIYSNGGVEILR